MNNPIEIFIDGLCVGTRGLNQLSQLELSLTVDAADLIGDAYSLMLRLVRYIERGTERIVSGETVRQGIWLLRFELEGSTLIAFDYNENTRTFDRGASRTLICLRDQQVMCNVVRSSFMPPRLDQKIVVTEGIQELSSFRGIRYAAPEHMSGWWLLSELYEGPKSPKRVMCIEELLVIRPDLMSFLAIETGMGFFFPFTWRESK